MGRMQRTGNKDFDVPQHRVPKKKHILAIFPAARARQRLDKDPMIALDKLKELEPHNVY